MRKVILMMLLAVMSSSAMAEKSTQRQQAPMTKEQREMQDGLAALTEQAKKEEDKEKQKLLLLIIAGMKEMVEIKPDIDRVTELSEAGQCKEAQDFINRKVRGGDKTTELLQSVRSSKCDNDKKITRAHLLRAERNGSKVAKMILAGLAAPVIPTPETVVKPWEPTAFVRNGERLPVNYAGIDPGKFLEMFKSKVGNLKKGEFETSQEFSQRKNDTNALLAPINTVDLYAFRMDKLQFKYNADTEAYENHGDFFCNFSGCYVANLYSIKSTYTAQNGFGASFTVERRVDSSFFLSIPENHALFKSELMGKDWRSDWLWAYKLHVPLEKARSLEGMTVAVLFIGRVAGVELLSDYSHSTPKSDYLFDIETTRTRIPFALEKIICYVVETGEILKQWAVVSNPSMRDKP